MKVKTYRCVLNANGSSRKVTSQERRHNSKPLVVRVTQVTEQQLRERPYRGVIHF